MLIVYYFVDKIITTLMKLKFNFNKTVIIGEDDFALIASMV